MVLNHCMLHPEPAAGVSGMAQAHGLQVEDLDLEEVVGHQLLKPLLVPPLLRLLCFTQVHSPLI